LGQGAAETLITHLALHKKRSFLPCLAEISASGSTAGSPASISQQGQAASPAASGQSRGGNTCTLLWVLGEPLHSGAKRCLLSLLSQAEARLGLRGGGRWGAGGARKGDRWLHSQPGDYRNKLGKSQAKQLLSLR